MKDTDLLHTHRWTDGNPRQFKHNCKAINHRQCTRCRRDFAQGLDGDGDAQDPVAQVTLKIQPPVFLIALNQERIEFARRWQLTAFAVGNARGGFGLRMSNCRRAVLYVMDSSLTYRTRVRALVYRNVSSQ
jgi:hypothetical protein